jgi:hypothetical protein
MWVFSHSCFWCGAVLAPMQADYSIEVQCLPVGIRQGSKGGCYSVGMLSDMLPLAPHPCAHRVSVSSCSSRTTSSPQMCAPSMLGHTLSATTSSTGNWCKWGLKVTCKAHDCQRTPALSNDDPFEVHSTCLCTLPLHLFSFFSFPFHLQWLRLPVLRHGRCGSCVKHSSHGDCRVDGRPALTIWKDRHRAMSALRHAGSLMSGTTER